MFMTYHSCPLCQNGPSRHFYQDKRRDYFRCVTCQLVFVLPEQFLSAAEEKAEYDLHQNSSHDKNYRRFLNRLFEPLNSRLASPGQGLDFGSGPGPTLSLMFAEAGHTMSIYDPFYAADISVWEYQYDFITATEVVEHLHYPQKELNRLWTCLKPDGILGIMTKLTLDKAAFAGWHYKNDLTHVCFFSKPTFVWLATQWQARLTFVGNDVILFENRTF